MNPKGRLLLIGGAEERDHKSIPEIAGKNADYVQYEILKEMLREGDSTRPIEVISAGSEMSAASKEIYRKVFKQIGFKKTGFLFIENKMGAADEKVVDRIEKSGAVLLSGGDQFHMSTIIGGTAVAEAIREKYMNDSTFIAAGTSAGAMVMPKIMINKGGTNEALISSDLHISSGLGLLEQCIVDSHFVKRGRFGRLAHAVVINPGEIGIGLGEDTALVIRNGYEAEVHGSGMVVIIDGKHIQQTNIIEASEDSPVFVENLTVHLLVSGCRFSLKERKLANPAIKKSRSKAHVKAAV